MTDYYIRITDEEPLSSDEALWFKLDGEQLESEEGAFLVLSRNEYNHMLEEYHNASERLADSEEVAEAVGIIMQKPDFKVTKTEFAEKIQSKIDPTLDYTYEELNQIANNLDLKLNVSSIDSELNDNSENPVQNKKIKAELDTKVSSNTFDTFKNSTTEALKGKSATDHKHTGWVSKTVGTYGTLQYNDAIRIASFRYYRSSNTFSKTGSVTIHKNLIDANHRPANGDAVLSFYNVHLVGFIDDDTGDFQVATDKTGTFAINCSGMWRY